MIVKCFKLFLSYIRYTYIYLIMKFYSRQIPKYILTLNDKNFYDYDENLERVFEIEREINNSNQSSQINSNDF